MQIMQPMQETPERRSPRGHHARGTATNRVCLVRGSSACPIA
jgi:hypothetical protein